MQHQPSPACVCLFVLMLETRGLGLCILLWKNFVVHRYLPPTLHAQKEFFPPFLCSTRKTENMDVIELPLHIRGALSKLIVFATVLPFVSLFPFWLITTTWVRSIIILSHHTFCWLYYLVVCVIVLQYNPCGSIHWYTRYHTGFQNQMLHLKWCDEIE